MSDDPRVLRLAAFLYGMWWVPGRQAFLDLPAAARRQWIEDARSGIAAIDGVEPPVTTLTTTSEAA